MKRSAHVPSLHAPAALTPNSGVHHQDPPPSGGRSRARADGTYAHWGEEYYYARKLDPAPERRSPTNERANERYCTLYTRRKQVLRYARAPTPCLVLKKTDAWYATSACTLNCFSFTLHLPTRNDPVKLM